MANKYMQSEQHFARAPIDLEMSRSRMRRASEHKTSFNVGDLVPIYVDEVLPGDTIKMDTSFVARLSTLITPVMDNLYMDMYWFFVPSRILWEHFVNFMGQSDQAWTPSVEYTVPQLSAPSGGWTTGTIADYMGIPIGVSGFTVNALPFRAYAKVVDDWFRDQNLQDPILFSMGDATVAGTNGTGIPTADIAKGGPCWIAAKYHDVFTSALPAPQKGPDVQVPLGSFAPVISRDLATPWAISPNPSNKPGLRFVMPSGANYGTKMDAWFDGPVSGQAGNTLIGYNNTAPSGTAYAQVPANLWADLSEATAASINQLRLAFQIQKYYERLARGGSRYTEILKSMFGVTSPDASLQRSQYLGSRHVPIRISQVVQQSATDNYAGTTPQGNVSGMSHTVDVDHDFTQSFTEHGYLLGLAVVRYPHTYQQGLDRMWSRQTKFDFYLPVLANIGEQGIRNSEIMLTGTNRDNQIFGYQEAWYDYRYKASRISGEMRSSYALPLDSWHFGDYYYSVPVLSDLWIREDKSNVDRTLAVQSVTNNQLIADFHFSGEYTRIMPMYSIPGLIDHH